ncbi:MAG: PspC domain-containing protein [Bacteroidales bacterium]|nr:PspC domain-containing protein [Bacteroidales bacterium]
MEQKVLYRSRKNSLIAGVCGGLGEYLNTDPLVFRVLFLVAILIGGSGLLVYIILWIALPEEKIPMVGYTNDKATKQNEANINNDKMEQEKKQQHNSGNLWGGLILITLGAIFLIDRFVPRIDFDDIWPVILIVVGIILISKSYQQHK